MSLLQSDFYLYCPSYGDGGLYPDNVPTKFKVKLPRAIDLYSYEYEVALAEITTPRHWHKTELHAFYIIPFKDKEKPDLGIKEHIFGNGKFILTEQIVDALTKTVNDSTQVSFRKVATNNHIEITVHSGYMLYLPSNTAKMLGFERSVLLNGTEPWDEDVAH